MKSYVNKHPIVFTLIVLSVSRLLGLSIVQTIIFVDPDLSIKEDLGWLLQIVYLGAALLLIFYLGDLKQIGIRLPRPKEWLLWIPALVFPIFIMICLGIKMPSTAWQFVTIWIAAFGVAANEEIIFRGLLMHGLLRKGMYQAIFVPALIFGLLHLPNVFMGTDIIFAIFQTCWAFLGGIALGAMRIRNQSLIPLIVFHFLVDATEYMSTGEVGVHPEQFNLALLGGFIGLNVCFVIYALWLLHIKKSDIQSERSEIGWSI